VLREAAAQFITDRFMVPDADPNGILVSTGYKMSAYHILSVLAKDTQLIGVYPTWSTNMSIGCILGLDGPKIYLKPENNFKLTPAELDAVCAGDKEWRLKPRRAMLWSNPHNPTGQTYTFDEMKALAEVLRKHNILVISEELFAPYQLNGSQHVSMAHKDVYPENTILITGLNKAYSAGGYRIGVAHLPADLRFMLPVMVTLASNSFSLAAAPTQYAAVKVFEGGPEIESYETGCARITEALANECHEMFVEGGIPCLQPRGGIYMWLDLNGIKRRLLHGGVKTGVDISSKLLQETGVGIMFGDNWGMEDPADMHGRFCLSDFDGAAALKALPRGPIDSEWVHKYVVGVDGWA
jgi:aspartate aminotransferase